MSFFQRIFYLLRLGEDTSNLQKFLQKNIYTIARPEREQTKMTCCITSNYLLPDTYSSIITAFGCIKQLKTKGMWHLLLSFQTSLFCKAEVVVSNKMSFDSQRNWCVIRVPGKKKKRGRKHSQKLSQYKSDLPSISKFEYLLNELNTSIFKRYKQ